MHGNTIYCDSKTNMWSQTLSGTYAWGPGTALPAYAKGNCNNLTADDIVNYPACKACYDLGYAGFDEGWGLPPQGVPSGEYCNAACGYVSAYCAPDRTLWNLGVENCPWSCSSTSLPSCTPAWDTSAVANGYWSSSQNSATSAWNVGFGGGYAGTPSKSGAYRVRCFLGQN